MSLEINEKAVCRKVGKTFELAAAKKYHPVEFTLKWLTSRTAFYLYEMNLNEIAQSAFYQLNSFEIEMKKENFEFKMSSGTDYSDVMYWCGYFFTYWMYQDDISGIELAEEYDIEEIMKCYETYHTMSCKTAVEKAKEDYKKQG